ncbi:12865_t:CDS:2, partial [Ambispora gerdemannii]
EIDRVLKKVSEGVATFEEIFEKIQATNNANQKEKLEQDLKKEIKKLQRNRDQIKTWISSNDIKDKRALLDNRKLIEQQMEKFKACEKEMKTKAYSKEGLLQLTKMDPKEKEKMETCEWLNNMVEQLGLQIEAGEAEIESLQVVVKKGRKDSQKIDRLTEVERAVERHKWHTNRLELILRLLENGNIPTEKVINIQEDVKYYVESNQEPDFAEDENIYDDLNLEEEEELYGIANEDHQSSHESISDEQPTPQKEHSSPVITSPTVRIMPKPPTTAATAIKSPGSTALEITPSPPSSDSVYPPLKSTAAPRTLAEVAREPLATTTSSSQRYLPATTASSASQDPTTVSIPQVATDQRNSSSFAGNTETIREISNENVEALQQQYNEIQWMNHLLQQQPKQQIRLSPP